MTRFLLPAAMSVLAALAVGIPAEIGWIVGSVAGVISLEALRSRR